MSYEVVVLHTVCTVALDSDQHAVSALKCTCLESHACSTFEKCIYTTMLNAICTYIHQKLFLMLCLGSIPVLIAALKQGYVIMSLLQ